MSELTNYERETIISYNEAEETANVHTHNKTLRRKLEKLAADRPKECRLEKVSRFYKAVDYTVPKAWVRIYPPRQISEEQRVAMAEKLKTANLRRKTPTVHGVGDGLAVETSKDTSEESAAVDGLQIRQKESEL